MNEHELDEYIKHRLQGSQQNIPESVRLKTDKTLRNIRKKKNWLRRLQICTAAICLAIACIGGAGLISPAFADILKTIPIVESIFNRLGDSGTRQANKLNLSTPINVSSYDQGIKMTIHEIMYDGVRLSLSYRIESDRFLIPIQPQLYVEGESFNYTSSGILDEELVGGSSIGVINIEGLDPLPDSFQLQIRYNQLMDKTNIKNAHLHPIEGDWNFEFPVTRSADIRVYNIQGVSASFENQTWIVNKVTLTPVTTSIELEISRPRKPEDKVDLNSSYQVLDDRGIPMQLISYHESSSPTLPEDTFVKSTIEIILAPLQRIPESLTVRPYSVPIIPYNEQLKIRIPWDEESLPITLSQGSVGQVTVTKIEFNTDTTLVYYTVEGADPYVQAGSLYLEDSSGQLYTDDAIIMNRDELQFMMRLPALNREQSLHLYTSEVATPKITKELEIMIPLDH